MKFKTTKPVILASGSPRRRELLELAGIPFNVLATDVFEPPIREGETPADYSVRLASLKAETAAAEVPDAVVIGSDTVVHLGGSVYGKPSGPEEARVYLKELSGRTHSVSTGVCIIDGNEARTFGKSTEVAFREIPDRLIDAYVSSGDPLDKAGAYGIQTGGALFVNEIRGDYHAVVGLPVADVFRELDEMGIIAREPGKDEP
ncbi:Maf family protein [Edaphobacillus lindanitolerans]|uniref:dTTP/UTP pyrophosphatase n=1 Tax=Edaphobacillus lindanitolerans TaxID=550447 RepID=A0A1U7PN30_9BACI|nr:nucleoside triphosphate pyrophosphatase [Edaphobacillus lindanitolerans]SIT83152.1 septum formation protein [Edaphobacillus lindanitolerans]